MNATSKQKGDTPMDPTLRLQPGQERLTPEQGAEAEHFAEAYIQAQFSTEPADEQEAEAFLLQAYEVAGLAPPSKVVWLDGPLQLLAMLPALGASLSVWDRIWNVASSSLGSNVGKMWLDVDQLVRAPVEARVWGSVVDRLRDSAEERIRAGLGDRVDFSLWECVEGSIRATACAYEHAASLAFFHFFDVYLAPNALHALACFNQMASGYWLGEAAAALVRRPRVLSCDAAGLLHSATGKCLEHHDGWGFYAWHGVRVSERVILAPDRLSREDFLNAENVEVRRIIQERMGERFVSELGGVMLDSSSRGTLYEVRLPDDDPDEVARYVQVQDASSERQYFLRVPPIIQTAAEAVAWSFGLSTEDYGPAQET